ncbi:hypothetical protein [Inhella sp.]|uniref:hypothetical protein n=1 Tax=Inhella sp. TaxID=1921806 RepID=UPI0035B304CB
MPLLRLLCLVLAFWPFASTAQRAVDLTAPVATAAWPAIARDWLPWAWQGHEAERCPRPQGQGDTRCVWPARLQLAANGQGARFTMELQVFGGPSAVALPGEESQWPQELRVNGQPAAALALDGRPNLRLPPGRHRVEGLFAWASLPQDLQLPPGVATLELSLDGQRLTHSPDSQGRVWLRQGEASATAPGGDSMSQRTVRLLQDGLPPRLQTQVALEIGGAPRELRLPALLLEGWQLEQLDSPLPARLQPDGSLLVQARAGSWQLRLSSRHLKPLDQLALPAGAPEETWLFAQDAAQRVVSVSGPAAIDATQIEMPEDWRRHPAYRVQGGEALKLATTRRGVPEPEADQLKLQRTLWLDFDGGGLSWRDEIQGRASRSTRMSLPGELGLGRAAVDGMDQPITQQQGRSGFALRQLDTRVVAEGRLEGGAWTLPASGWQTGMASAEHRLNLPPGWQLLHAGGVASAGGSWVEAWTLWDVFFVLLGALAAGRMLGWKTGALLGLTLLLAWHEMPLRALWFVLLGLVGLLQVLPTGGVAARRIGHARSAVLGLLLLAWLSHAVEQVRWAIYPQLMGGSAAFASATAHHTMVETKVVEAEADASAGARVGRALAYKAMPAAPSVPAPAPLAAVDPKARVQTGPGLPQWQWGQHRLSFAGPVSAEQTLRLWLLPPWATALWRLLALALLATALLRLAGLQAAPAWAGRWRAQSGAARWPLLAALALVAACLSAQGKSSPAAQSPAADAPSALPWPSDAQLQQLRERSLPKPLCAGACVGYARAWLSARGEQIQLRLEVHAQAEAAFPLPGQGSGWRPSRVLLNGEPAPALQRDAEGLLWAVAPEGVSQWLLSSELPEAQAQVALSLPLPLRALQTELQGWQLSGLDARGLPAGALTLSRSVAESAGGKGDTSQLQGPPLVRVERVLSLGLQWQVLTRVQRLDASRAPLSVRYALLEGETVTDGAVSVADGEVRVASLTLGAQEELLVTSSLAPRTTLTLQARPEPQQLERWLLQTGGQWHVQWPLAQGATALAPVAHHAEDGRWQPQWQPWPGEQLQLAISRPEGVAGQTLTVDALLTEVRASPEASEVTQRLALRTSLGTEHALRLPEGAQLLRVSVNGEPQPLQAVQGLLRVPLQPGLQQLELVWRQASGMGTLWRSPSAALGVQGVNDRLSLQVPGQRIALLAGGPKLGPAFLFWGVLAVLLAVALGLQRLLPEPLSRRAWLLLCLGLAPASLWCFALLAGWFVLLERRVAWAAGLNRTAHNLLQVLLLGWTLLALGALLYTLQVGLLGYPDLMVTGNGSTARELHWYSDRLLGEPTQAWVLSMPVWLYRLLMLAWAGWLALALMGWLRWAWAAFSAHGTWRAKPAQPTTPPSAPEAQA